MVTNGCYGSVNRVLSFGVPLVATGPTEDKADVNARIAWSGAGIDLRTNTPELEAIRRAVRTSSSAEASPGPHGGRERSSPPTTRRPRSSGSSAAMQGRSATAAAP
jgi:hypothetical protein